MQIKLKNQIWTALLCALVAMAVLFVDSSAQQQGRRRRKASRRATYPVSRARTSAATNAQSDSPEIISTEDNSANGSSGNAQPNNGTNNRNRSASGSTTRTDSESELTRRALNKLSTDADYERLSRAEQRAENLNAQLRDVVTRQSDLQARAEQLDIDLQPGNIERSLAGVGSLHPEELRAQRRRQLESEKTRVRSQLDLLDKNRASLETSIASADAETNRLRQRVDAANAASAATQTNTNSSNTNSSNSNSSSQTGAGTAGATASPSPSPTPSPNDSRTPR